MVVTTVLVTTVMKEMAEPVLTLMSVPETHVMVVPYVLTLQALTNAKNVRLVIVPMDPDAWILTNVHAVLMIVIEMLIAKIQKVVLLVLAMLDTTVMAELVVMSTNVLLVEINVIKMLAASILLAVTSVSATPVMKEMVEPVWM